MWQGIIQLCVGLFSWFLERRAASEQLKLRFLQFVQAMGDEHLIGLKTKESYENQLEEIRKKIETPKQV